MKKILSFALVVLMVLSLFAFTACGKDPVDDDDNDDQSATSALKFGFGVNYSLSGVVSATDEVDGSATLDVTAATVLVDKNGKIVKCKVDTFAPSIAWDNAGVVAAIPADKLASKYELGNAYGMSAIGKAEWYVQADAFCSAIVGKTLDEAKAMVSGETGNADIINAGCTMKVGSFIAAVEKAVNNAAATTATANSTLQLGMAIANSSANASDEADGKSAFDVTIVANALDSANKVVDAKIDCVQASVAIDNAGVAGTPSCTSKYELGNNYGMSATGKAEWYVQADAFAKQLVGKTASEIAGLQAADGHGNDAVISAGCTIYVTDFVKAAVKAATVK